MFETIIELLGSFIDIPTSREVDEVLDGVDKNGKRIGPVRRAAKSIYMVLGVLAFIVILVCLVVLLLNR